MLSTHSNEDQQELEIFYQGSRFERMDGSIDCSNSRSNDGLLRSVGLFQDGFVTAGCRLPGLRPIGGCIISNDNGGCLISNENQSVASK